MGLSTSANLPYILCVLDFNMITNLALSGAAVIIGLAHLNLRVMPTSSGSVNLEYTRRAKFFKLMEPPSDA